MSWMEFIVQLSQHLAWPVAAVALAVAFRQSVRALLTRLLSAEGPGVRVTFGEGLAQVEDLVEQAEQSRPELPPPAESPGESPAAADDAAWAEAARRQVAELAHETELLRERLAAQAAVSRELSQQLARRTSATEEVSIRDAPSMTWPVSGPERILAAWSMVENALDTFQRQTGFNPLSPESTLATPLQAAIGRLRRLRDDVAYGRVKEVSFGEISAYLGSASSIISELRRTMLYLRQAADQQKGSS